MCADDVPHCHEFIVFISACGQRVGATASMDPGWWVVLAFPGMPANFSTFCTLWSCYFILHQAEHA